MIEKDEEKLVDEISKNLRKLSLDSDVYILNHKRVSPDVGKLISNLKLLIGKWIEKYGQVV